MARIRTIKPDFWKSEKVGRLTGPEGRAARLLFIGLWNFCDDAGVMRGTPTYVRSEVFPYDEDVSAKDVERWLSLLEVKGFIVRYQRDSGSYLWVRGFTEHQVINRPSKTNLPEPSDEERAPRMSPHGALTEPSRREGKGREVDTEMEVEPSAVAPAPPGVLVHVEPTKSQPKPKKQPDSEHHALWRALEAEYLRVMGHPYASSNGGQDAAAVKWFRETAPPEEAVRRWGALLEWSKGGFPSVTGFASLRQHWNAPQVAGGPSRQRHEAHVGRGSEGSRACAGCGSEGPGFLAGCEGDRVWLGYECGCGKAWSGAGLPYDEAAAWATARRAGRAA
jgi:hypothetical protein